MQEISKQTAEIAHKRREEMLKLKKAATLCWLELGKQAYLAEINKDYESLDSLLRHIFRAARGYMTWMCDKLNLPDPEIEKVPESNLIEAKADEYMSHLLEKWCLPLKEITEDKFHAPTYTSRWGVDYCIDAMLEHAVMHPIRHEFQLRNFIIDQKK